jgi:hypothetical protein
MARAHHPRRRKLTALGQRFNQPTTQSLKEPKRHEYGNQHRGDPRSKGIY